MRVFWFSCCMLCVGWRPKHLLCRVVSCRVVSCRVVSCRVVSCRVVSCRVVACIVFFVVVVFFFLFSVLCVQTPVRPCHPMSPVPELLLGAVWAPWWSTRFRRPLRGWFTLDSPNGSSRVCSGRSNRGLGALARRRLQPQLRLRLRPLEVEVGAGAGVGVGVGVESPVRGQTAPMTPASLGLSFTTASSEVRAPAPAPASQESRGGGVEGKPKVAGVAVVMVTGLRALLVTVMMMAMMVSCVT